MPREDVKIAQGTDSRTGFRNAVQKFCAASNGKVVPAGGFLSMATEVFLNGGKDPQVYGVVGFVYCLSIACFGVMQPTSTNSDCSRNPQ